MTAVATVEQDLKTLLVKGVNLPGEIADIIIDNKTEMERIDAMQQGRKCVRTLVDYYSRVSARFTFPGDWDVNTLEDFCSLVRDVVGFSQFINEDWFREHHKTLFNKLLKDVQESSCEYAKGCILRTGTISEGQRRFIHSVYLHLLKPLTEMRRYAGIRPPYHPGFMHERGW